MDIPKLISDNIIGSEDPDLNIARKQDEIKRIYIKALVIGGAVSL